MSSNNTWGLGGVGGTRHCLTLLLWLLVDTLSIAIWWAWLAVGIGRIEQWVMQELAQLLKGGY